MDKKLNVWFIFKFTPLHKNNNYYETNTNSFKGAGGGGGALIQGRGLIVEHGPLFKEI